MNLFRIGLLIAGLALVSAADGAAQTLPWVGDGTAGYAGFVDDSTKHFAVVGGGVRKYVTPRISIGPEFVVMSDGDSVTDRHVMLTGNVVYDAHAIDGVNVPRVTPFVVGGLGQFWSRDQVRNGPFWSSDPAFTVGAGVRGRMTRRVFVAAEYRFGWELHHRFTGTVSVDLR